MPGDEPVNVLLVDDRPGNLTALESILGGLGANLIKASSGEDALRTLLKEDVAVILLDVQMPVMDGFETAELIRNRKLSKDVPIIFITAIGKSYEEIHRGYKLGAVDYILKPFEPVILRWKVSVFVDLHRKTRDIERHLADIQRLNQDLNTANEEMRAFSYSVAHDLRAPLRSTSGLAGALLEDYGKALGEEGRLYLRRIISSTGNMDDLITDLFAYSKLTLEELNLQAVPLDAVFGETLGELRDEIEKTGAEVRVETPLPTVLAHRRILVQIAGNLVSNALKFVKPGEKPRVRIHAKTTGDTVRLAVEDQGIGIEPRHQESIFRIFERLHGVESYPGTGIGLAIVRKGAERMGGRAGVESAPDTGSGFWVDLPAFREGTP